MSHLPMEDSKFQSFINQYPANLDNPEWLSKAVIELSALLYIKGQEMANARANEDGKAVGYMEAQVEGGKKMSVAESEKRAIVDTKNYYETCKLEREAIIETINSIKKRLEVLSWEHRG